jgi:hypothetical protein
MAETVPVEASVGAGDMTADLPQIVAVAVRARAGFGAVSFAFAPVVIVRVGLGERAVIAFSPDDSWPRDKRVVDGAVRVRSAPDADATTGSGAARLSAAPEYASIVGGGAEICENPAPPENTELIGAATSIVACAVGPK